MTHEEVIAMAREAGFIDWMVFGRIEPEENILMRFATAVAAHEREACAELLEALEEALDDWEDTHFDEEYPPRIEWADKARAAIAKARGDV